MTNDLNYRDKARDKLIKELRKLQQEYDSLKTSYEKDISECKLIEKALEESEERYRLLFENSGEAILHTNPDGSIYSANPEACRIFGMSEDEICKLRRTGVVDLNDKRLEPALNERKKSGKFKGELNLLRKDGTIFPAEVTSTVFWDTSGNERISMIIRDISKRKQTEKMLSESEEHYKSMVQIMPDGVAIHTDGKVVFANEAACKIMNAKNINQMIGISVIEYVHPDYREIVLQRIKKSLSEQISAESLEETFITFNGQSVQVNVTSTPFLYLGKPSMLTVFTDITKRKQTEEALRLEKENFRHSLDDSPLGIRIVSAEGNTIYANKTSLNFYGYDSIEELQKTPLKDRYTPESYLQAQKRKRQRKRGDLSATEYEISIVRKDGGIRHLQVFRKEVLWDGVRQFQVICNDITERKRAEEEVIKSKKLMEDLHKHLNEILENERASISREIHDQIGQSLTALKLDLNWMHKYINTYPEAVTKLKGMIELVSNTIKDVQRISSDLRPGILDDLGLVSAIEWYCDEFEKRTGIKCILKLDTSDYGDSQINLSFFRVLQETLTNVIRHANASSVTIKLHQTQKGTTLAIMDNGIGITREKVESAKSLGLIGMRERVRQFGGKVGISSGKGHGTKLTIFIPEKKKNV